MHIARIALVVLPALLALAGCEDPTKDKPKATVSSAVPASPQATAPAAATLETLSLDPAASSVQFVGSKITRKHEGKFEKVSGTVSLAGGKLEGGKISVDIETASVQTDDEKLDGHLPEDVKQARVDAIMEVQQQVAFGWAAAQVGKEHPVLIDGPDPEFASHFRGRTYADAPEIDCAVRVKGKNLRPGDFVRAKVTAADGYDLAAKAIGKPW